MKSAYTVQCTLCNVHYTVCSLYYLSSIIIIQLCFIPSLHYQLRFSRPFRPVLLLTRYRELRRILETLTDMTANLVKLTAVIIIFVALFAWIGVVSSFMIPYFTFFIARVPSATKVVCQVAFHNLCCIGSIHACGHAIAATHASTIYFVVTQTLPHFEIARIYHNSGIP